MNLFEIIWMFVMGTLGLLILIFNREYAEAMQQWYPQAFRVHSIFARIGTVAQGLIFTTAGFATVILSILNFPVDTAFSSIKIKYILGVAGLVVGLFSILVMTWSRELSQRLALLGLPTNLIRLALFSIAGLWALCSFGVLMKAILN